MFKELKVIEHHYTNDKTKEGVKEIKNTSGEFGSVQLSQLSNKYTLIESNIHSFQQSGFTCDVVVTTYLFSCSTQI